MRRIAFLVLPLMTLFPLPASALTVRDVVELTRAGLGEDIILALIEVDPSVFPIDAATLKTLKAAGVGERVIVAMSRRGRTQPPLSTEPVAPVAIEEARPPEPQVIVIEHHDTTVREVPVAVPVYVPVPVATRRVHVSDRVSRAADPVDAAHRQDVAQNTWIDEGRREERAQQSQPIYWGGHLRPDAWGQPTPKKDKD